MTVTEETINIPSNLVVKKFTTNLGYTESKQQDSTTWICPPLITEVRYLVVAGGGGGGWFDAGGGGGGGAGGLLTGTISVTPGTQYNIIIGRGGRGGYVIPRSQGYQGGNSQFGSIIATGGGAGGGWESESHSLSDGGSGGGRGASSTTSHGAGGIGIVGQGNNGGTHTITFGAGGGGGAGVVGGKATTKFRGANGGNGLQSNITGETIYYAGGGGGGGNDYGGSGGLGGGGTGQGRDYSGAGSVGTDGLGGGGGGANTTNSYCGGSGVVILQYTESPKMLVKEGIEWI